MSEPTSKSEVGSLSSKFARGETVALRTTMELGRIVDVPILDGGEFWYRVQFGRRVENLVEDDLEGLTEEYRTLESLARAGRWGTLQAFRCALAIERLTLTNRTTVYSFNSQRILFEPYQYKPLLKILDSPDRRLLIADEVGLGKTIEAALVLTELEARQELDKVLVICPSRLRDKWREELNRKFNQDFEVYTSQTLREYLTRLAQNPDRSRLRAIVSMNTIRNQDLSQLLEAVAGYIDFAVVDEAHHGRNPSTLTAEMLQDIARISGAVLFLTATPLHLGTQDLYTLLHALRPTEFRDPGVFDNTLRRFAAVHRATAYVRSGMPQNLVAAADELIPLFSRDGSFVSDPLASQVISDLKSGEPPDRRGWIDLERRVDELHPFSSIITRTRKRDVQENVAVRRARVFRCQWTEEEAHAYNQLIGNGAALGWLSESLTLGQIQRARQAASSIHAVLLQGRSMYARTDDESTELSDVLPSEINLPPGEEPRDVGVVGLPSQDSKFNKLLELLETVWSDEPDAKVLIFSFFVGTVKYIADRLEARGHSTLWITGEVPSDPRNPEKDERGRRIRQFKSDKRIRVLASTEVGSEGLDFQFCHHLVNYDLPWNPMVVEQRIGRIDRYGQKASTVQIHNLVVEGTVEDRILYRLYERIGIFRESIGDLEVILGETVRDLQREYLTGQLTPAEAERKVEQAALAIENRRALADTLEQAAGELFGHEEYIRQEMARVGRLGRHITGTSLLALIESFLKIAHPHVRVWAEGENIFALNLTDALEQDIRMACSFGQIWRRRKKGDSLLFTPVGAVAFESPDIELINSSHPLVRAAVNSLRPQMETPAALVGQSTLGIAVGRDMEIAPGTYFVVVVAHEVTGMHGGRELDPIVWSVDTAYAIDAELGERLLHLVLEQGCEWSVAAEAPAVPIDTWGAILSEARRRHHALKNRKLLENEALYQRRKTAVEAEYTHIRGQIETRRNTAIERERSDQIITLFDAQLQKAELRYRDRLAALDSCRKVHTSLSDPIAACAVLVRRS